MTTVQQKPKDEQTAAETVELKGRLVLVTGEVVEVPAEGLNVSTQHYSEKYKTTVQVVGSFLID
jgi:hypothetical protein